MLRKSPADYSPSEDDCDIIYSTQYLIPPEDCVVKKRNKHQEDEQGDVINYILHLPPNHPSFLRTTDYHPTKTTRNKCLLGKSPVITEVHDNHNNNMMLMTSSPTPQQSPGPNSASCHHPTLLFPPSRISLTTTPPPSTDEIALALNSYKSHSLL